MVLASEIDLAPGLLVSMPQLLDPNFTRAVVLMLDHNDEGSFGLVINQPTDLPIGEVMSGLEIDWNGDPDAVMWSGGPVMPTSGWMLHEPCTQIGTGQCGFREGLEHGATLSVTSGLELSTSPENLRLLCQEPPARTRFLLGYSGWGPGQLAQEMARSSWLHADVDVSLIFDHPRRRCGIELFDRWELIPRTSSRAAAFTSRQTRGRT